MDDLKEQVLVRIQGEAMLALLRQMGYEPHREGREYKILCPFHDDHKPSLMISLPGVKSAGGIFKCFACGAGHDVFSFVEAVRSLDGFRATIEWMASQLGILKGPRDTSPAPKPEQREVARVIGTPEMDPMAVLDRMNRLRAHAIDAGPYCNALGVRPDSLPPLDAFVCLARRDRKSGEFIGGVGQPCLIVPMRTPEGRLTSLRFRSLAPREPGERSKRWSLSVNRPGADDVAQCTTSSLMATARSFDEDPPPERMTIVVEGESDLAAMVSMLIDHAGPDENAWPARPVGLPGAGSCHDLLVRDFVGSICCVFMDQDVAGKSAVFDRPVRRCELCGRRVAMGTECSAKNDGARCPGRATVDFREPPVQGLLSKLKAQGVTAMAAFPPADGGKGKDLRDLYRAGWTWGQLEAHVIATGTARTKPLA